MKKRFLIAAVVAALAGTSLHFFYDILPYRVVAIFAPINESPWEHLKLLFWPTLLAAAVLVQGSKQPLRLWSAFFFVLLAMPIFLLVVYYLLVSLQADSVVADIALYFVTMLAGFALAYILSKYAWIERIGGFLLMAVILYASALILFSFAAPPLAIFQEKASALPAPPTLE